MSNKTLFALFYTNFSTYFIGAGLVPVLPLYAGGFGVSRTTIGFYLALTYVAITGGTLVTGWLAQRLAARTLLVGVGVLGAVSLLLLGQATSFWQAVLATAAAWFLGGIGFAVTSLYTGLYADKGSRGKSFGLMFLTRPLSALIAGVAVGRLVTGHGYGLTFTALGLFWASLPVVILLALQNRPIAPARRTAAGAERPAAFGSAFYLLALSALLATLMLYMNKLGTSLSMQTLGFSAGAVSSTTSVSALLAIPFTLLVGTLSDRMGRRGFLLLSYALAVASAVALVAAGQLWHFWLAATLLLAAHTASSAVASALATDLLPAAALSRGLPWFNAVLWGAGIMGYAGTGYIVDALGLAAVYGVAAALAVAAIITLAALPRAKAEPVPVAASATAAC